MDLREYMKDRLLRLDGGTGTMLQKEGLLPGEAPEKWNLSHPDRVRALHRAYYDAGSDVVTANTFGANLLHFSHAELDSVICAAMENAALAREDAGGGDRFIALDIGPSGRLLRPLGDLDFEDAVRLFAASIRIGVRRGADLILIETMSDSYETKAALLAARENCDLPVFVTNVYGEDGRLTTGASPAAMTALLEGMHADAIGVNCSLGPRALRPVVRELLRCASVPVICKPNAGLPQLCGTETVYDVTAEQFAADMADMVKDGVRIVGGCCGTTPEFIRRLTEATSSLTPLPVVPKDIRCASSGTHAVVFGGEPVLIGERINPTGKKRFKEALRAGDIDYMLREGIRQQECGVHALDVNVGLPELCEEEMLPRAVCELQAVTDLPLQIDSSSPAAMGRAMRLYNGKPIVNSVNGKETSMREVFPLLRKYGGVAVALTLDEKGIPDTAEGRLRIAEKIVDRAALYGIAPKDLIFDPLAMTISADAHAAAVTLETVRLLRDRLGVSVSLGISNVSFGLPSRDTVNAVFFAAALACGLSAAILNPYSDEMMRTYRTWRALAGLDPDCAQYIEMASRAPDPTPAVPAPASAPAPRAEDGGESSPLRDAIRHGRREQAAALTDELLKTEAPLSIIEGEIIPALDAVGRGFEAKTVFLPQLLMSAEAAQNAFGRIRDAMSGHAEPTRMRVVLATVHGDIHDIGKNIVRLLLENYGFAVTDLGRDVPPQRVLDAARETGAPLVGLSALMTTTVPAMEETIRLLHAQLPGVRVVVGGAVLTQEYADQIGADHYARDAMETVRYAESVAAGLTN